GVPQSVQGEVRMAGVATQLVQPIAEGLGLPLVLPEDAGPVVDVVLTAATEGAGVATTGSAAGGLEGLPPTNIDLRINSQNVTAQAALRLENGVATTREGGVTASIASAGPMLGRIMAAEPGEEGVAVTGRGGV